jgi:hypothetical protein
MSAGTVTSIIFGSSTLTLSITSPSPPQAKVPPIHAEMSFFDAAFSRGASTCRTLSYVIPLFNPVDVKFAKSGRAAPAPCLDVNGQVFDRSGQHRRQSFGFLG